MADAPGFDQVAAHKFFAVDCFNKVWGLLDKPDRTAADDQEMVEFCLASVWHWTQREDRTDTNTSVGYWQASRVYATVGLADEALRYGGLCLEVSRREGVPPFYLGFAYEALARAASIAGDRAKAGEHLTEARRIAAALEDPEEKKMLEGDLEGLG